MYVFSKHTPSGLSSKLINTFVLPQFDGPQMIPRIEVGNMFPCLRIFSSIINLIEISHSDCLCLSYEPHIFSHLLKIIESSLIETRWTKLLSNQNVSHGVR